ncbi:AAA family ATPase [Halostella pelagica]|uniref:AAA family ATPase n=1 Tax=Halostella pelagica TaxID=2583824 RepID=UPI0010813B31|nr:AAA family ATPase [Halostella pelagica]
MKISRFESERFAIDESPTIKEQSISGKDLLLYGGNRSGKTLTFNALLYGLFGRSGTFGVTPGQSSTVELYFDSADAIIRDRSHEYQHEGNTLDVEEGVREHLGLEENIGLQFVPSSPSKQPLSRLSENELLDRIRSVLSSEKQEAIERHRRAKSELEHLKEIRRRGETQPGVRELNDRLDDLPVKDTRNRIKEIKELLDLIESGRIQEISDRLQQKDDVAEELNQLYDRRRELNQTLKEKRRELGDASRYTQKINDLIIDAIQEFTCPVCGRLVEEEIARNRLPDRCPQCARPRDLSDLRDRLEDRVSKADTQIETLKEEIGDLEEELAEVKADIDELQQSEPELSDLNGFVRTALDQADYDIEKLRERTHRELQTHEEQLDELEEEKSIVEEQLAARRQLLDEFEAAIQVADERVVELEERAFDEVREKFTDRISEVYQEIAPDLGTEVGLTQSGELDFPGTGSEGIRSYERLSSGERRLVNLAFAITMAEFARENEEVHDWEVLVLDEPLTNLESDIQDAVARYLRNTDIQCIMTSPLDRIQSHFRDDEAKIVGLDRIETEDTTLEEYL